MWGYVWMFSMQIGAAQAVARESYFIASEGENDCLNEFSFICVFFWGQNWLRIFL